MPLTHDVRDLVIHTSDDLKDRVWALQEDRLRILAKNDSRGYRLPIVFANDNFLLTPHSAWSGLLVPPKPWGHLSRRDRESYQEAATNFLTNTFPASVGSAGHILVTSQVYSAADWEQDMIRAHNELVETRLRPAGINPDVDAYRKYIHYAAQSIDNRAFAERETYLFVRHGDRGAKGTGFLGAVERSAQWITEFFLGGAGLDDSQPDPKEVSFWQQQASTLDAKFGSSSLKTRPISRRHVEWLVRHLDSPGLPTPDIAPSDRAEWGAGEWRMVLSSDTRQVDIGIHEKTLVRGVEIDGPTGVSYACFLPISVVPNKISYEINWLHHAATLEFPVDASVHFEIIDPDRAEQELEQPIAAADAQKVEDSEAGVETDDTIAAQHHNLREAKVKVRMGREPLAYWQAVLSVHASTKEELLERVAKLVMHYESIHFKLEIPKSDQRELYYQQFPGSVILVEDWMHRSDPKYLAIGQPWLTTDIGDAALGPAMYRGHTVTLDANGQPREGVPTFANSGLIIDVLKQTATEAVAAEPGAGKSVSCGLKVAHEEALEGVTVFVWDPKGDFLPLKKYAKRILLDPAKIRLVDLYNPNASISLDPFFTAERSADGEEGAEVDERETSAVDVLDMLSFHLLQGERADAVRRVIRDAVAEVLMNEEKDPSKPASLPRVQTLLEEWRDGKFTRLFNTKSTRQLYMDVAYDLVQVLNSTRRETLGRLLFKPIEDGVLDVVPGTMTIFVALRMKTREKDEPRTLKTQISDIIAGTMTDYIRSLLYRLPRNIPKSIFFDEWHVIRRTSRAPALVDWLRRMGRSLRTRCRQLSQSANDFDKGSLSVVRCGWVKSDEEAEASCKLLGWEATDANFRMLKSLGNGEFMVRDALGRIGREQVDFWDDDLLALFNTQAKDQVDSNSSDPAQVEAAREAQIAQREAELAALVNNA